jgi:hypothetical protein
MLKLKKNHETQIKEWSGKEREKESNERSLSSERDMDNKS